MKNQFNWPRAAAHIMGNVALVAFIFILAQCTCNGCVV